MHRGLQFVPFLCFPHLPGERAVVFVMSKLSLNPL